VVKVSARLALAPQGGRFSVGLDAITGEARCRFNTTARPTSPGGHSRNNAPIAPPNTKISLVVFALR
jgi:hypothetical protein